MVASWCRERRAEAVGRRPAAIVGVHVQQRQQEAAGSGAEAAAAATATERHAHPVPAKRYSSCYVRGFERTTRLALSLNTAQTRHCGRRRQQRHQCGSGCGRPWGETESEDAPGCRAQQERLAAAPQVSFLDRPSLQRVLWAPVAVTPPAGTPDCCGHLLVLLHQLCAPLISNSTGYFMVLHPYASCLHPRNTVASSVWSSHLSIDRQDVHLQGCGDSSIHRWCSSRNSRRRRRQDPQQGQGARVRRHAVAGAAPARQPQRCVCFVCPTWFVMLLQLVHMNKPKRIVLCHVLHSVEAPSITSQTAQARHRLVERVAVISARWCRRSLLFGR